MESSQIYSDKPMNAREYLHFADVFTGTSVLIVQLFSYLLGEQITNGGHWFEALTATGLFLLVLAIPIIIIHRIMWYLVPSVINWVETWHLIWLWPLVYSSSAVANLIATKQNLIYNSYLFVPVQFLTYMLMSYIWPSRMFPGSLTLCAFLMYGFVGF